MPFNSLKVLINDEIPRDQWGKFLINNPYASPFQTPEFYELFNSVKNLSATAIAIEKSGTITALCVITLQREKGLKGFFSRRAIIYGGPLLKTNNEYVNAILIIQIREYLRHKAIYIEIRNFFDYRSHMSLFEYAGFKFIPWLDYQIRTFNINWIKERMSNSRKRQIKKALRNGVQWQEARTIKEIEEFFKILADLYRDKIKKPLFPFSFFKGFFESNIGKYLLVWYNNEIIGGIMCPVMPDKAIYEYYICGLDREYKEQYPSVMATWAAIEYANQNKIPLFDFMGAGSPDKDYGVRQFKERFGGELVDKGRFLLVLNPFLYSFGKHGLKLLSKINI